MGRHAAPDPTILASTAIRIDGSAQSNSMMESEIEQDRRSERRLVWYTLIALVVVAILVTARLILL